MNADDYFWKTKKRPPKTKPRSKPLPKAKEKYLEAEEALFQELEEHLIGSERKFQFESTKNWRFDFYIVKLNLLIEIVSYWNDQRLKNDEPTAQAVATPVTEETVSVPEEKTEKPKADTTENTRSTDTNAALSFADFSKVLINNSSFNLLNFIWESAVS